MSFWLQESYLMRVSRGLSYPARVFIILFLPFIILVLLSAIFICPKYFEYKDLYNTYVFIENRTKICKKEISQLKEFIESNSKIIELNDNNVIKNNKDENNIESLVTRAKKYSLECYNIKPVKSEKRDEGGVKKMYFNICLTGSFINFVNFLKEIKDNESCVKFCEIKINRWAQGKISVVSRIRLAA
jgi:Tfp pilus assembly protein PilO